MYHIVFRTFVLTSSKGQIYELLEGEEIFVRK